MCKNIIEMLQERALNVLKTDSPKGFLFSPNYIAKKYRELFGIGENPNFDRAFEIVAFGQGNEIVKMNSLQSSSLLSLLFFYPLFENTGNYIISDNVVYNKCFFEIKNKVVKFPSNVDILLCSEDKKKLLFLESKFTEYTKIKCDEEYGSTYFSLYEKLKNHNVFPDYFSIENGNNMKIHLKDGNRQYIEGIKQTISHIIGLFRGPYLPGKDQGAESKYLHSYKKYYDNAEEIIYSTILYNPLNNIEEKDFKKYSGLYNDIIINHRNEIIQCVKDWKFLENKELPGLKKNIIINDKILTYQDLVTDNNKYVESLPSKIRDFYNL
ncbi:MAG: hypothetical protein J1D77_05985 [Muribaculaceae bacterium]|nr:hypothetical protein [Muribaculaceae bacterium]